MKSKKKAFTLLELAICIGLIALIAGIAAVSAGRMYAYHRYQSDVGDIASLLNHLSKMAVSYEREITVTLRVKSSRLQLSVGCADSALPIAPWKDKELNGIQGMKECSQRIFKKVYTISPSGEITQPGSSTRLILEKERLESLKSLVIRGSKAFVENVDRNAD